MQTRRAYNILTHLISQGFETVGIDYGGAHIVLKSLSEKEMRTVGYYASREDNLTQQMYALAYSTYILGQDNVLNKRASHIKDIAAFYSGLPTPLLDYIHSKATELQSITYEALDYIEGYCYTPKSRSTWASLKGYGLLSEEVTGIEGTGVLGLNWAQLSWSSFNRSLDQEDRDETEFSNAVFIASATNPDGTKKISNSSESRKKMVVEEREEIAKYGSRAHRNLILKKNKAKGEEWQAPMGTKDDIVGELDRQMRGIKDRHDLFIDKYRADISSKYRKELEVQEEKSRRYRESANRGEVLRGSMPVTAEDMERHLAGEIDLKYLKDTRDKTDTSGSTRVGSRVVRMR